jgi:hypothetical protein
MRRADVALGRSWMEQVFIHSRWFSMVHLISCCLPSIKFAKSIDLSFFLAYIGQIGNSLLVDQTSR